MCVIICTVKPLQVTIMHSIQPADMEQVLNHYYTACHIVYSVA